MNIKRIIKEELDKKISYENDDMEWIKDVKTNQDIAQEIADETYIKDDLLYTPFPSLPFRVHLPYSSLPPFTTRHLPFIIYCEEQYGLIDEDDVWERYKEIIIDKINDHSNLNENESLMNKIKEL